MTTADSDDRHRQRRQPVLRAGALTAGVVTGAGSLLAAPPGAVGAFPAIVHRDDIALTDFTDTTSPVPSLAFTGTTSPTPTFDQSLHYLLDTFLGIGTKTLPQLLTGTNPNLTVGELLGMASPTTTVNTSLQISSLLDLLGLNQASTTTAAQEAAGTYNGTTVGALMDALNLNPADTMDQIVKNMGLANVTLDQILTPLGIPSTQTIYGVMDRLSLLNQTLADGMMKLGPITDPATQTVQQALQSIGLGGFYAGWFTSTFHAMCSNVTGTVDQAIGCVSTDYSNFGGKNQPPQITLNANQTIGYLLTHTYQLNSGGNSAVTTEPLGAYTIGQALNFNNTTTVQQFIDKLMVNMNVTAGQFSGGMVNGSPSGTPVMTNITGSNPEFGAAPTQATVNVAPADNPSGSLYTGGLGAATWGDVLKWFNVPPSETIATLIGNFMVNDVQLSHETVGNAMQSLVINPGALGSTPATEVVTDSTTVAAYLSAIGFATQTLDQLIGLN